VILLAKSKMREKPASAGAFMSRRGEIFRTFSLSRWLLILIMGTSPAVSKVTMSHKIMTRFATRRMPEKVTNTQEIVTRTPYRCAVGLMIKTDEVSEQLSCPRSGTKRDENGVGLASIEYGR
jgi:hypothetical protein